MNKLNAILKSYLKELGELEAVKLGEKRERKISKTDNDKLKRRLWEQYKANNVIIYIAIGLLLIIFIIAMVFLFLFKNEYIIQLYGGSFFSIIGIIAWLHKLWRDKTKMDIIIGILEDLTPRESVQFISSIFWKENRK